MSNYSNPPPPLASPLSPGGPSWQGSAADQRIEFYLRGVRTTGTVVRRQGKRLRVEHQGGQTWIETTDLVDPSVMGGAPPTPSPHVSSAAESSPMLFTPPRHSSRPPQSPFATMATFASRALDNAAEPKVEVRPKLRCGIALELWQHALVWLETSDRLRDISELRCRRRTVRVWRQTVARLIVDGTRDDSGRRYCASRALKRWHKHAVLLALTDAAAVAAFTRAARAAQRYGHARSLSRVFVRLYALRERHHTDSRRIRKACRYCERVEVIRGFSRFFLHRAAVLQMKAIAALPVGHLGVLTAMREWHSLCLDRFGDLAWQKGRLLRAWRRLADRRLTQLLLGVAAAYFRRKVPVDAMATAIDVYVPPSEWQEGIKNLRQRWSATASSSSAATETLGSSTSMASTLPASASYKDPLREEELGFHRRLDLLKSMIRWRRHAFKLRDEMKSEHALSWVVTMSEAMRQWHANARERSVQLLGIYVGFLRESRLAMRIWTAWNGRSLTSRAAWRAAWRAGHRHETRIAFEVWQDQRHWRRSLLKAWKRGELRECRVALWAWRMTQMLSKENKRRLLSACNAGGLHECRAALRIWREENDEKITRRQTRRSSLDFSNRRDSLSALRVWFEDSEVRKPLNAANKAGDLHACRVALRLWKDAHQRRAHLGVAPGLGKQLELQSAVWAWQWHNWLRRHFATAAKLGYQHECYRAFRNWLWEHLLRRPLSLMWRTREIRADGPARAAVLKVWLVWAHASDARRQKFSRLGRAYSHWQVTNLSRCLQHMHYISQQSLDVDIARLLSAQAIGRFDVRHIPAISKDNRRPLGEVDLSEFMPELV